MTASWQREPVSKNKNRSAKDASRRARKIAAFWQHAPRAESVASDTLFYWMNPIKCGTLYAVY